MAYVLLYSQNFGAGNSLFSETNFYSRDGSGTPSASGADPLYPEARFAEGVEVRATGGPAGEKTLDCWDSYHGAFQGYDAVGFHLNLPTYALRATGLTIPRGAAEVWYKPNTTSMSENTTCKLLNLFSNPDSNSTGNLSLDTYLSGGSWHLRLRVLQSFGEQDNDPIHTLGTTAALTDAGHTYRIEWNDGTLECAPDQYVRVLVDGAQVYEQTEAIDGTDLHANVQHVSGATMGFAGLFGEGTNLRIYGDDDCDESEPEPVTVIDNATPCSCPSTPGPASVPDPVGVLQPPTYVCEGGGTVEAVADLDGLGGCWAAGMAA